MAKTWGVARFYGMGSMEYLLESGQWLSDGRLFDGAPIRLFDSMAEADAHAEHVSQAAPASRRAVPDRRAEQGLTARKSQKRPTGRYAWQQHR